MFMGGNPEVLLPTDLDFKNTMEPDSMKEAASSNEVLTPSCSMKEPDTPILWTEVVRKGKHKTKTRSRNNNLGENDRCLLKY
jgi:hypothetical protein